MRTVAVLSALAEEQSGLRHQLLQFAATQTVTHAGRAFCLGELPGLKVILALSGIGKVAAATTATALIACFGAEQMVFTGVAGGLAPGVNVGDVVIANGFLQHDLDVSPLFPRYEVPSYGISRFATDAALTAKLHSAAQPLALQPAVRVHQGLIISGDRFVATRAESQALQAALPDALAVEMEGAAVAQVCHDYRIPYAAVRAISDRADDDAHTDFNQFVRTVASRYADVIVMRLLSALPL